MKHRHQCQLGPSVFHIERRPTGWWVVETWSEMRRQGYHAEAADEFEAFGPFTTAEEAEVEKGRLQAP